jgi:hypothetical protein
MRDPSNELLREGPHERLMLFVDASFEAGQCRSEQ